MIREEVKTVSSGYLMLLVLGIAQLAGAYFIFRTAMAQSVAGIIAARKQIVRGAVSMVDMALEELKVNNVVDLDEERKAAMVSNLLVVLCGEEGAQPVLNTGSLYT